MVILDKENRQEYSIEPYGQRRVERMLCPKCSESRKKKREKILAWNNEDNTGFCHNCQTTFYMKKDKPFEYIAKEKREYKLPEWSNNTVLDEKIVKWFEERKISQFTLRQMKVTSGLEWMPQRKKEVMTMQFNYFRNDKLINTKFRDGAKNFKFVHDAELVLYNLDGIKDKKEIYLVEGEMDALSLWEVGIHNVVSVPNGANTGRINFDYLDSCIDLFENAEKIVIATDNDIPGINLREQLSTRFGLERCFKVDFGTHKDANEYLIAEGREKLKECLKNVIEFPIDGIYTVGDFRGELDNMYEYGLKPGLKINIPDFDKHISFEFGRLYTVTGIPGHGKSEFIDFVIERLNVIHGVKCAYFSPENHPLKLHVSKLIEKLTGRTFSKKYLDPKTYNSACDYVEDNFHFIEPSDNYEVDTVLDKARSLVFRHGVKILVLDPYNKFEHQMKRGEPETQYISRFLDKITTFAKRNDIIVFLVAHPRKMNKTQDGLYEVPTLYDISGSANFYNKTDFGICVYLNKQTGYTTTLIQKVKFKHLGETGNDLWQWNFKNGRYAYFDGQDINSIEHDESCHLSGSVEEIEASFEDDPLGEIRNVDF